MQQIPGNPPNLGMQSTALPLRGTGRRGDAAAI